MNFNIGDTMGGYEIVGVLGSGGMGEVYRVRNVISDRVDAMKVLLANLQRDHDFATRFLREIKVQARLVHPNIAQLYTAFEHDGNLMMIMELIDGSSLLELLQGGRIPLPQVIDYTRQALTALSYAHAQGVIHRDIKPGNIMVTRSGSVKLMDFGIAKAATDRSLTVTGNMIGSLYYMSPEQVKAVPIDSRSDLYSVGIVLYQMATGKKPFDGDSEYRIMRAQVEDPPAPPAAIDPAVPGELSSVILRALAKDPAERFQTGEEFGAALERVAALLREADGGATRMLGSQGAAAPPVPREVPTASLSEPSPQTAASAAPPPQSAPTGPREAERPAEARAGAEERPQRSRTSLWIAAGIAAAVLIVAATQLFDWMATSPGGRSPESAAVETPLDSGQPVSEATPETAAPGAPAPAPVVPSVTTTPPTTLTEPAAEPVEGRSAGETASQQPRPPASGTPPNARPGGENPPLRPPSGPRTTPPRANPAPADPAPTVSNPAPVQPDPVSPPLSDPASPPAQPSRLQAGAAQNPSGTAASGSQTAAPPAGTSQQAASPAGGQTAAPAPVPPSPEPAADRVYLPNEVDSLPEVLHRVQPRYSAAAAQVRAEGVVRLEAEIWPDGRVHGVRMVQGAGHADLDRNAVAALRQWNFIPARKDGVAVKVRARIDFPFSLQTTSQRPALSKEP